MFSMFPDGRSLKTTEISKDQIHPTLVRASLGIEIPHFSRQLQENAVWLKENTIISKGRRKHGACEKY